MADNVQWTAGTGTTVATDDVGGAHHQRVKISVGANGVAKDLQPATPYEVASGTADVSVLAAACTLLGWSFAENAASAAVAEVIIRDGTDDTGEIVAIISLNPDESVRESAPNPGIALATGAFVEKSLGTTRGCLWIVP